jgi:hypothetical protein
VRFFILFLIVLLVAGIYFQWFHFSSQRDEQTKEINLTLKVNPNKIKHSVERAESALAGKEKIEGKVETVHHDSLTVSPSDKRAAVEFRVEPATKIERDGNTLRLQDLHEGEPVTVTYKLENGKNVAQSIMVDGK